MRCPHWAAGPSSPTSRRLRLFLRPPLGGAEPVDRGRDLSLASTFDLARVRLSPGNDLVGAGDAESTTERDLGSSPVDPARPDRPEPGELVDLYWSEIER